MTTQDLTRALDSAASAVCLDEDLRRRIRCRAQGASFAGRKPFAGRRKPYAGQPKPYAGRRKPRLALALVLGLTLLAAAALAVGAGVFSALSTPDNSRRLERLDAVSQAVDETVTLPAAPSAAPADAPLAAQLQADVDAWAFTLTMDRAYCDGHRLYFAYTLAADRPARTLLGEGSPAGFTAWEVSRPGKTFRQCYRARTEQTRAIAAWLDGHAPAYAVQESFSLGDGARLLIGQEMGDVLAIQDSASRWLDDRTQAGFIEVLLPEPATGEVSFTVSLNRGATVYYQDGAGLHETGLGWDTIQRIPFTVPVGGSSAALTGAASTESYAAQATLLVSQVDVTGTVLLDCPDAWLHGWDDPDGGPASAPCVGSYRLLAGDAALDSRDTAVQVTPEGCLRLFLRFDLPASGGSWQLVPLYTDGRAAPDGSILLR